MCKTTATGACLPLPYSDYEKAAQPYIAAINAFGATQSQKRLASEQLGSLAAVAYNANRHGSTFGAEKLRHTEFSGCGVFDLVFYDLTTGKVEVKEAKGGGSQYGDCYDIPHKTRVKQCTQEYNEVIIHKMKHSHYGGRHPSVPCAGHIVTGPFPNCKNCKAAEAQHRQNTGHAVEKAVAKGDFTKIAVRGNYDGNCLKVPQKLTAYEIDLSGNVVYV